MQIHVHSGASLPLMGRKCLGPVWTTISFCCVQVYLWWHLTIHLLDLGKHLGCKNGWTEYSEQWQFHCPSSKILTWSDELQEDHRKNMKKNLMPWFDALWEHSFLQLSVFPSTSFNQPNELEVSTRCTWNQTWILVSLGKRALAACVWVLTTPGCKVWNWWSIHPLDIMNPPKKWNPRINSFTIIGIIVPMKIVKLDIHIFRIFGTWTYQNTQDRGIVGSSSHYALQWKASYCCSRGSDAVTGWRAYWVVATSCWLYLGIAWHRLAVPEMPVRLY